MQYKFLNQCALDHFPCSISMHSNILLTTTQLIMICNITAFFHNYCGTKSCEAKFQAGQRSHGFVPFLSSLPAHPLTPTPTAGTQLDTTTVTYQQPGTYTVTASARLNELLVTETLTIVVNGSDVLYPPSRK